MYREETDTQEGLQAIRPVYNTSVPSASTAVAYTDHEVVHVCTNVGVEGQEVIYWEDILFAFKGALSIRYGSKILLPLRGSDGKRLDPLCIAAIPDAILDVHMECQWMRADTAPLILEPPQSSQMSVFQSSPIPGFLSAISPPTWSAPHSTPTSTTQAGFHLAPRSTPSSTRSSTRSSTLQLAPRPLVHPSIQTSPAPASRSSSRSSSQSATRSALRSPPFSPPASVTQPKTDLLSYATTQRESLVKKSADLLEDFIDATPTESKNSPVQPKVPEIASSNTTSSTDGQTKVSAGTQTELFANANMSTKASSSRSTNSQKTQGTTAKKNTRTTVEDITETPATAELRRVEDQVMKAISYKEGSGGSQQNYVLAMDLFRKAAVQGNSIAQYNIGLLHEEGHGVMKDSMKAASWYRKAADQGHKDAQSCLGTLYVKGDGIQKNNALALQWFLKAAEQGDTSAQFNLGCMYFKGEGVPVHNGRAMTWFKKAAQGGHLRAREAYEDLKI